MGRARILSWPPWRGRMRRDSSDILVELAFGDWLAKQDTLDGWRHLATSFLPVDALDRSFDAGRLSVVHTAPPETWYSPGARRTKRDRGALGSGKGTAFDGLMLLCASPFLALA